MGAAWSAPISSATMSIQPVTPTTGQTVVATPDNNDRIMWITPAGTLAALTITFPADATSQLGQIFGFGSTQIVTVLTLSGATILNGLTALAVNDAKQFVKVAAGTWAKFGGNT